MASLAPPSSTFYRKFRTFLRWMRDQGIEYTDGLTFELGGSGSVADMGVRAVYPMKTNDLIATIPKLACLTVKTTAAAQLIEEGKLGGIIGLTVALMFELSLEERSKWFGYLQLLPRQQLLPFLWSPAEIDSLLLGTELHKAIIEDRILMEEDWKEFIAPLTMKHVHEFPPKWFSLDHYLMAKTLVDSRAFEVDAYYGYGMVPLADLFNHKTAAEDVHFTSVFTDSDSDSDTKVSSESCKTFEVETNESESSLQSDKSGEAWEGSSRLLEMILVKDVSQGSEIFNTYGTLSNAALLHRYGFTEDDNPFDIVNIDFDLILDICLESLSNRHIRRRTAQWRKIGCVPCLSQGCEYFEICSFGKPQLELLMWLYLVHLSDERFEDLCCLKDLNEKGIINTARALGWIHSLKQGPASESKKRTRQGKKRSEDKSNTNIESWLMTPPVCQSILEILEKRDSLYPTASLADDLKLLSITSCKEQPQLFHAIRLRSSERSILRRCQKIVLERQTSFMSEPTNIRHNET